MKLLCQVVMVVVHHIKLCAQSW